MIVQHILTKLGQLDLFKLYLNVFVIFSTFQVAWPFYLIQVPILLNSMMSLMMLDIEFRFGGCTPLSAMSNNKALLCLLCRSIDLLVNESLHEIGIVSPSYQHDIEPFGLKIHVSGFEAWSRTPSFH